MIGGRKGARGNASWQAKCGAEAGPTASPRQRVLDGVLTVELQPNLDDAWDGVRRWLGGFYRGGTSSSV